MKKIILINVAILALIGSAVAFADSNGWLSRASTTKACVNRNSGIIYIPGATRAAQRECGKNDLAKIRLVIIKG